LGWQPPAGRLSWLRPLIVIAVVSAVTSLLAFTFFADIVRRDLEPFRRMLQDAPLWLAFLALAVGAPLSEELLFRGYLLHRLRQTRLGFAGGALVANVGWTMLHYGYSWLSLADVFLAGLLFSWALWRTGSIWVPIAFHALYNAAVFSILLIPNEFI
jgi:membrane protease YdiL (CAAX protease family)